MMIITVYIVFTGIFRKSRESRDEKKKGCKKCLNTF